MDNAARKLLPVSKLRAHLGDTQQAFAERLRLSLRAVARYESDRIPTGRVLILMARCAIRAGRQDLAGVFMRGFCADMCIDAEFAEQLYGFLNRGRVGERK